MENYQTEPENGFQKQFAKYQGKLYSAIEDAGSHKKLSLYFEEIADQFEEMVNYSAGAHNKNRSFAEDMLNSAIAVLRHYSDSAKKCGFEFNHETYQRILKLAQKHLASTFRNFNVQKLLWEKNLYYFLKRDGFILEESQRRFVARRDQPILDIEREPSENELDVFFANHRKEVIHRLITLEQSRPHDEMSRPKALLENPLDDWDAGTFLRYYDKLQVLELPSTNYLIE